MTAFGFQIGWLTIRVTLLALVATGLSWWCARRAARSAVLVLAAGVTTFLALSVAAFCPMPDISRWSPFSPSQTVPGAVTDAEPMGSIVPDHELQAAGPAFSRAWDLLKEFSGRAPASPAWQQGGALLAALYGLGLAIASLRLLSGWLAVGRLRRRSRPISDAGLLALTDAVRLAVGCSRRLELRECTEPGLAATVGWRRPVIFLPPEWPDWPRPKGERSWPTSWRTSNTSIISSAFGRACARHCTSTIRWCTGCRSSCAGSKSWPPMNWRSRPSMIAVNI